MTHVLNLPAARTRWLSAVFSGLIVSIALLWLMQALIHHADKKLDNSNTASFLDFVRIKPSKKTSIRPEKPVEPKVAPKTPDIPPFQESQMELSEPSPVSLNIKPLLDMAGPKFILAAAEANYSPLVRIAPMYPENARRRGIEGYCTVQFDVNTRGITTNIQVSNCASHYFHRSSINAAARFRYQPRIVDGKPVMVRGVKTRFKYHLEDNK